MRVRQRMSLPLGVWEPGGVHPDKQTTGVREAHASSAHQHGPADAEGEQPGTCAACTLDLWSNAFKIRDASKTIFSAGNKRYTGLTGVGALQLEPKLLLYDWK